MKLIIYFFLIVLFWSFDGNYIFYLLAGKHFSRFVIISYIPFYLVTELLYKIRKKTINGKTSYVSGGHFHWINNKKSIAYYEEANKKDIFEEIVLFDCYSAKLKIKDKKLILNTYSHIVSKETMEKICTGKVEITLNSMVEYVYINSSIGKYGIFNAIKNAGKIIKYVKGKSRCKGEIDKVKIKAFLEQKYNNLTDKQKYDFNNLSKEMFGTTYEEIGILK